MRGVDIACCVRRDASLTRVTDDTITTIPIRFASYQ